MQLSSVQDGSAQLGSVKVGSTQATFREWLCATGSVQVGSARACSAQCALHELRRAISHESGLRKLHCSRLLRASCSLQAAARKCSVQVARKCSEQVALRKCSASSGNVLRVLFLYLKVANFPAGAAGVCSAYYVCT